MSLDYEIASMKKTLERRILFIELTLNKINASIQSLEREIRKKRIDKSDIMISHGADPQNMEREKNDSLVAL